MCQRSCLMYWLPWNGEGEVGCRLGMRADCSLGTHWLPWLQIWPGFACFAVVWLVAMVPALKFQLLRQMINEHVAANFLAFCLAGQEHPLWRHTASRPLSVCVGRGACHSLTCVLKVQSGEENLLNLDRICKDCSGSTWKQLRQKLKECLMLVAVTLQL